MNCPVQGITCGVNGRFAALLLPLACAQLATTAAGDKAALLEAKAAAETSACSYFSDSGPCPLNVSWSAATQPCGVGWEDERANVFERIMDFIVVQATRHDSKLLVFIVENVSGLVAEAVISDGQ